MTLLSVCVQIKESELFNRTINANPKIQGKALLRGELPSVFELLTQCQPKNHDISPPF